jgi:hypothetical protein
MKLRSYAILFDLDGVIADWRRRLHYRDEGDWDRFYAEMQYDEPLPGGAIVYNLLAMQCRLLGRGIHEKGLDVDVPMVDIVTCRPEKMRATTVAWLASNGMVMPRNLHMRPDGDERPPAEIKLDMYRQFYADRESVLALFEDNAETIAAFEAIGIACLHVRE